MALHSLLLSFLLAPLYIQALQVTPNSPCAAVCQDSDTLDASDPRSSNTKNSDITCDDSIFGSSKAGIKWMNCMSCLQNSTFVQGNENDQMWFLYNSRYAVSYCVFGFPNATDVGSSPCTTSPACGLLENSLETGVLDPHSSSQYGYCSVDRDAMTGSGYASCLACISASGTTQYIANHLVALEAGCLQQPAPGMIVGLNSTLFSPKVVGIVDPSVLANPPKSETRGPTSTMVAVIVIGTLVFLAVVAACVYICRRKRKNRLTRATAEKFGSWMPQSPLSFQCQAHTGLKSPELFQNGGERSVDEMSYSPEPKGSLWHEHSPISPFQNPFGVSEQGTGEKGRPVSHQAKAGITSSPHRRQNQHPHVVVPLHSLNTSVLPSPPSVTYHSPSSAVVLRGSPSDSYTTPTSTTSTRSTTQLLPRHHAPYSPADFAGAGPGQAWPSPSAAPPAPPPKSPRMATMFSAGRRGGGRRESGSPVETMRVGVTFPPPPTGR